MSKLLRFAPDFAALLLLYARLLHPRWKRRGRRVLMVNTLMFLYLCGVLLVTLMPILTALPFCFDHPYIPMRMAPFEDVVKRHGDFLRQIVLNVVMTVPFGFLYPLQRRSAGKPCGLLRCMLASAALSLSIELLQPLLHGARRADITDVITNTTGGLIGAMLFRLFLPLQGGN